MLTRLNSFFRENEKRGKSWAGREFLLTILVRHRRGTHMPFGKKAAAAPPSASSFSWKAIEPTGWYARDPTRPLLAPILVQPDRPVLSKSSLHACLTGYSRAAPPQPDLGRLPGASDATRSEELKDLACCYAAAKAFVREIEFRGYDRLLEFFNTPVRDVSDDVKGVIHIGAHVGQEAHWYYSKVGTNCVHIEANPAIMPRLQKNVGMFGHTSIQAVLWNAAGEERDFFFTDNDSLSASVVGNLTEHNQRTFVNEHCPQSSGSTKLITTDWASLCAQHPQLCNPTYDMLVIDTQGAEYQVVEGIIESTKRGPALLGIQQFRRIVVECSNVELYEGQKLQPELEELLVAHGFVNQANQHPVHGDVLYVNTNYQCS